jgi:catechol 2,3-dioxygenase-like lactoylglutathione lyase family enzyme
VRISLDHIHIFASNLSATVDFFTRMLGATIVWDEEAAGVRNVRLALGKGFIHVYDQPPKSERGGTIHHLGIETDDLDGLIARMERHGHRLRNAIRELPKFRYVMIAGPDELLIELFQCHEPERWQLAAPRTQS